MNKDINDLSTDFERAKRLAFTWYNLIPNATSVDIKFLIDSMLFINDKPTLRTVVRWLAEFNVQLPKEFRGSRNKVKADRKRKDNLLNELASHYDVCSNYGLANFEVNI